MCSLSLLREWFGPSLLGGRALQYVISLWRWNIPARCEMNWTGQHNNSFTGFIPHSQAFYIHFTWWSHNSRSQFFWLYNYKWGRPHFSPRKQFFHWSGKRKYASCAAKFSHLPFCFCAQSSANDFLDTLFILSCLVWQHVFLISFFCKLSRFADQVTKPQGRPQKCWHPIADSLSVTAQWQPVCELQQPMLKGRKIICQCHCHPLGQSM